MHQQDTKPRKRYRTVPRTCEYCGAAFYAYPYEVRDGYARFCSRSCGKRRNLADQVLPRLGAPTPRGCRSWVGAHDADGYGFVTHNLRQCRVSHAIWYLHTGHWPTRGQVIGHHCDCPPCGEFTHLFLTDNDGNRADMLTKERQARGERQGSARLTADAVLTMRARYAAGGISMPALAAIYGVTYATARSAIRGKTWRHLTATPPLL